MSVNVGDFILDHAVIRCDFDFCHPAAIIEQKVSYWCYHARFISISSAMTSKIFCVITKSNNTRTI